MRTHRRQHRSKIRRTAYLVILVIAFAIVTPVLAEYEGPSNRTITEQGSCTVVLLECMFVESKGDYRDHRVNSWSCSNESKPWRDYPSQPSSAGCSKSNTGYKYWEREYSTREVTYPPATIQGTLQNCTLKNGWCSTVPQLSLSTNETLPGHRIIGVEGTLNGKLFACPESTCTLSLLQGNNSFTYWAVSSWGDTSLMGTLNARVDTVLPSISGALTGTAGSNGWYTSPVTFEGSASDDTSGLAAFTCTLDGTTLNPCSPVEINGEGLHTLVLTARDNAGQTTNIIENASIDTRMPTLDVSLAGTVSSSDPAWYTAATLNGSASDASPGSGLSTFEYRLDQNDWTAFPVSGELVLPDGEHTVEVRATDNAGLTASSLKDFSLDSVPPAITIIPAGTSGANNWFTTDLQLTVSASDETSGVEKVEYSLDNDSWAPVPSQLVLTDGIHEISFWAEDQAGLVSQVNKTYQVDTRLPRIAGSFSGVSGQNDWFTSNVTVSASANDPQPGSGIDTFTYNLNNSPEDPFISPLVLSDGQYTLQLHARDKAGLSHTMEQVVNVDTIAPTLDVLTVLPEWVGEFVSLEGTASDGGSGLSTVEISTDGGQTWQAVTGTTSWSYRWDTSQNANGAGEILVQVTDQAGLSLRQSIKAGVDNKAPIISLPDSWFQWDTINLDIQEEHSGLAEASLEISDPQNRWPARIIQLDAATFPLRFKWDRRFADGSIAPEGKYNVRVMAVDNLGNSSVGTASVKILINLPPGPTSTFIPTSHLSATPTISSTATPTLGSTVTQAVVVKGFGTTLEPDLTVRPKPVSTVTPRATPAQNKVVEWFESLFPSHLDTTPSTTEISSPVGIDLSSPSTTPGSNVLWGASAAAVMGSLTAFALEEKRKQQEQQTKLDIAREEEKQRRKRIKKKQMTKLEAQWAQERAWEADREAKEQQEALYQAHNEARQLTREINDEVERVAEEKAEKEARIEEKKRAEEKEEAREQQGAMAAYYAAMLQNAKEVPPQEPNWWEKTKTFVSTNIIDPVNTYVYEPFVKPVLELREQIHTSVSEWVDKNVYEPFIEPAVEGTKQFFNDAGTWAEEIYQNRIVPAIGSIKQDLASGVNWLNQQIYQPYVKPFVETTKQNIIKEVAVINEKIYQPFIKPVVEAAQQKLSDEIKAINEKIYQPYIKPLVEKAEEFVISKASQINEKIIQPIKSVVDKGMEKVADGVSWVDKNIYQPILAPVVNDINKHIYKPLADKTEAWWGQYGEWVHGALDAAGFVPGLGEIADGLNGLVYLAEGRYVEAAVSAMAMIPVIGDLGKAGKWGLKLGAEVLEEATEKVAKEFVEQTIKEGLEEATEKVTKEFVENTLEDVSEKAVKELIGQTLEEGVETASEKVTKASIEEATKGAGKDLIEKIAEKTTSTAFEGSAKKTAEKIIKKHGDQAVKLLEVVSPKSAKKLLDTVDRDVLDYVMEQGPDAVEAFSKWSGKDLRQHGAELALRAKKDAKVLDYVKKLIDTKPIDPKNLTTRQKRLIQAIAGNSTQYSSGGQVVLGKWVNQGDGFVKWARETGSVHYNPHPEMWNMFGELGGMRDEVAWLVNQQVVQTGVTKSLPFEYSFNGIRTKDIPIEKQAVEELFSGATTSDLMTTLDLKRFPIRMKELQELYKAGYKYSVDEINNSYIISLP